MYENANPTKALGGHECAVNRPLEPLPPREKAELSDYRIAITEAHMRSFWVTSATAQVRGCYRAQG